MLFHLLNFGLSNFYSLELIQNGKRTGRLRLAVGEVNDQMPVTYGNTFVHVSEFDKIVETSHPLPELGLPVIGPVEEAIGLDDLKTGMMIKVYYAEGTDRIEKVIAIKSTN